MADDEWATVGSSNLDPMSLALNLEANVVIRDRAFNQHLASRLDHLMRHSCTEVTEATIADEQRGWGVVRSFLAYHFTRYYPSWALSLPRHVPRLIPAPADTTEPLEPAYATGPPAKEKT